jgi:hypothetical protein
MVGRQNTSVCVNVHLVSDLALLQSPRKVKHSPAVSARPCDTASSAESKVGTFCPEIREATSKDGTRKVLQLKSKQNISEALQWRCPSEAPCLEACSAELRLP